MTEPFKLEGTISFLSFLLDYDVINRTTYVTLQIILVPHLENHVKLNITQSDQRE